METTEQSNNPPTTKLVVGTLPNKQRVAAHYVSETTTFVECRHDNKSSATEWLSKKFVEVVSSED
jgi:hypothetical protein